MPNLQKKTIPPSTFGIVESVPSKFLELIERNCRIIILLSPEKMLSIFISYINLRLLKKESSEKKQKTWRDIYKELTGYDPLICEKCHIEMEFCFARYDPLAVPNYFRFFHKFFVRGPFQQKQYKLE